jgi:hypothetical protein
LSKPIDRDLLTQSISFFATLNKAARINGESDSTRHADIST